MFKRFSLYSFLTVAAWLSLLFLMAYLNPDEKTGGAITLFVYLFLTQVVIIFAALVMIVLRLFIEKTIRQYFMYNLAGMFNLGWGVLAVYFVLTGELTSTWFIVFFAVNLLTGALMLLDAGRPVDSADHTINVKTNSHEHS